MKKFEIQYISRYYEEKNYCSEIISAKTEDEALIAFANIIGIEDYNQLFEPMFYWEDGSWMSSFKCINEVKEVACEHCNGTEKLHLTT